MPVQTTGFSLNASVITRALFNMLIQDMDGDYEFAVLASGNRRQDHREWWEINGNRITTGVRNQELYLIPKRQFVGNQANYLHHVDNTINHNFAHENRDFFLRLTDESKQALCRMVNRNPLAPGGNNGIANLSNTVFNRTMTVTVGDRVDGGNVAGHVVNFSPITNIDFTCPL